MKYKKSPLYPDAFYHIYNRANGNERMFKNKDNYAYFLKKYRRYIHPVTNTYVYCLMPNHFHFLIEMKDEATILKVMKDRKFQIKTPNP